MRISSETRAKRREQRERIELEPVSEPSKLSSLASPCSALLLFPRVSRLPALRFPLSSLASRVSPAPLSTLSATTLMKSDRFRFEDMDIWQRAVEISMPVFDIADALENQKKFRFGEQLRAAMLSISNNMAEGSGSASDIDFANFLNISRRSIFEIASMLLVFHHRGIIAERPSALLSELIQLSKMTLAFRNTLKKR